MSQVELKTSHESTVQMDEKFSGIFGAYPSQKFSAAISVSSFRVGKTRILVHCTGKTFSQRIDYNTKEVLARWLLRLDLQKPNILFKYPITAPIGEISQTTFTYQNASTEARTYEFSTSHPEIAYIPQNTISLQAGDKAAVPITLKVMDRPKQAQILVYAVEKDGGVKHEAMLFTISYVPQ